MYNPKRVPVYRVHKLRGGKRFHRRFRTFNERKLNIRIEDDPPARAKRCDRNLPSWWDDLPRCVQRCWKSQRKTRWRPR